MIAMMPSRPNVSMRCEASSHDALRALVMTRRLLVFP
jgi:hypothetical protein